MIKPGWVPPLSPHGLLQESLWPDEWAILVSCMMLNCTTRKQVEKVLPQFFKMWPRPIDLLNADKALIVTTISPLGFGNRRADNLIAMSREFLKGTWVHAKDLPGIGVYGSRAWEIFCRGELRDEAPVDHALVKYWNWAKRRNYDQEKNVGGEGNEEVSGAGYLYEESKEGFEGRNAA